MQFLADLCLNRRVKQHLTSAVEHSAAAAAHFLPHLLGRSAWRLLASPTIARSRRASCRRPWHVDRIPRLTREWHVPGYIIGRKLRACRSGVASQTFQRALVWSGWQLCRWARKKVASQTRPECSGRYGWQLCCKVDRCSSRVKFIYRDPEDGLIHPPIHTTNRQRVTPRQPPSRILCRPGFR